MTSPATRGSGSRTRSRSSSSSSREVKEVPRKKTKLPRNNNNHDPVIILPSAESEELHRRLTRSSSSRREVKLQKKKTKLPRNSQQRNAELNNNSDDPVIILPSAGSAEDHNNNNSNEDPLIILHKVCSGEIHNNNDDPVVIPPSAGSKVTHNNNSNDPVIIPPCAGSKEIHTNNSNSDSDPVITPPCAGSEELHHNENNDPVTILQRILSGEFDNKFHNNSNNPVIIPPCAGSKEINNSNSKNDPVIIPPCAVSKEIHTNNRNNDPVIIPPCARSKEIHTNNRNNDPVIVPPCAGSQEVVHNNNDNDPVIILQRVLSGELHFNEKNDPVTILEKLVSGEFDNNNNNDPNSPCAESEELYYDDNDPLLRWVFFGEIPKNAPVPQPSREPVSERQTERLWAWAVLSKVRQKAPLIHCITSSVSMDLISDTLLACGASPAMVHSPEEIPDFTPQAHALYINVDSLATVSLPEMKSAAVFAAHYKKPWVLDPVGIGSSRFRLRACLELLGLHPTVVKGNGYEIIALARASKALDIAQQPVDALAAAKSLALASGAIVAVSGGVSIVTDGQRVDSVYNGVPMMGRITSAGCSVAALVAAFVAVDPAFPFEVTSSALSVFGIAGELGMRAAKGPASLRINLIDSLYGLDEANLRRLFKISYSVDSHNKA